MARENLQGAVCLVTGAGRRLGRAMARAIGERGGRVAAHYRSSEAEASAVVEEIRRSGGEAHAFPADLRRTGAAEDLVAAVADRLGALDVLVHSASTFYPTPVGEVTEEQWDDLFDVNLKSAFFGAQAAARRMRERGRGRIVLIADVAAYRPWTSYVPYSAAKAGVVSLTRGLARALAPEIRVNAIAPGTVLPPETMTAEEIEHLRQRIPLQRIGEPEDVVEAMLFLLEGAPYMTGEVLLLDGGRHLG